MEKKSFGTKRKGKAKKSYHKGESKKKYRGQGR